MIDTPISGWETVHTVHDFYDGPRNGVADYRGVAHAYRCEWDDVADDWSATFLLSPITSEQFSAVEETWAIWRRYRDRFQRGELQPGDKHPALAADLPRYEKLHTVVDEALVVDETRAIRALPEFRRTIEPEHDFEVRWRPCAE